MQNHISTKSPKVPLRLCAEKWIHLSHKRTLGIEEPELKLRKKGIQEDSCEKDKSPKGMKVLKWHGNEDQMNISIYHMLQSCGVQADSYLKTEVTMKLIFRPKKSYLDLRSLGFHSPKSDYHQ